MAELATLYPWLSPALRQRFLRSYGSRTYFVLQQAQSITDLGQHFGHGLYETEVRYLMVQEWACSAEDILWRRTKLGLYFSAQQTQTLTEFIESQQPAPGLVRTG